MVFNTELDHKPRYFEPNMLYELTVSDMTAMWKIEVKFKKNIK